MKSRLSPDGADPECGPDAIARCRRSAPRAGEAENLNLVAGRKAIESKDFASAVGHLVKAVQENPNDADGHSMLGYTYRKLGSYDKSMEHYQHALKIDPNHRGARYLVSSTWT
jgi:Flp pilus assembly protein TadD